MARQLTNSVLSRWSTFSYSCNYNHQRQPCPIQDSSLQKSRSTFVFSIIRTMEKLLSKAVFWHSNTESSLIFEPEWAYSINMIDIFRGLKTLIKVSHVHIDSTIFRLHYTFTVMCLLAFSLIVTTRQYVGNPIDCVHTKVSLF